jgi:hypothetical protein
MSGVFSRCCNSSHKMLPVLRSLGMFIVDLFNPSLRPDIIFGKDTVLIALQCLVGYEKRMRMGNRCVRCGN